MFPTTASISPECVEDEQLPATWSKFHRPCFMPWDWCYPRMLNSWRLKMSKRKGWRAQQIKVLLQISLSQDQVTPYRRLPLGNLHTKRFLPSSKCWRQKKGNPPALCPPLTSSWCIWLSNTANEWVAPLSPIQPVFFHMFLYNVLLLT